MRASNRPETMLYSTADVISSLGTSMSSVGSVGDTSSVVRQGEVVVVFAGTSDVWEDWTKDDVSGATCTQD